MRCFHPTRETPMWSGPRRWPVPMIALAEQQPASHVPRVGRDGGLTGPEPGGSPGETHAPTPVSAAREVAMITNTIVQALAQARLADLHDQARRDALARAARRARRARRQHTTHRAIALRAVLTQARVPRRKTSAGTPGRVIRDG